MYKQMHLILVKMKLMIMLIILRIVLESSTQITIFNTKIKNKLKSKFEILLVKNKPMINHSKLNKLYNKIN